MLDRSGASLREPLRAIGGDPDAVTSARWPDGAIGAYLELHIEQGPALERSGNRIGVVQGITGRTVLSVVVHGTAGHAGTVPMDCRADALTVAARVVLAVEDLARRHRLCTVATVGRFEVDPDVTNVIPGTVRMTVDLRDLAPDRLLRAEQALHAVLAEQEAAMGTGIRAEVTDRCPAAATDPALRAAIAAVADDLALPRMDLPSGAGHDAQMIAHVAPIGMIFVPSEAGCSHVPEENTADEDLVAGARVLLHTALRASRQRRNDP